MKEEEFFITAAVVIVGYILIGFIGVSVVYRIRPKFLIDEDEKLDGSTLFWSTAFWPVLMIGLVALAISPVMQAYINWINKDHSSKNKDIQA